MDERNKSKAIKYIDRLKLNSWTQMKYRLTEDIRNLQSEALVCY